jgi:hypothetical protein
MRGTVMSEFQITSEQGPDTADMIKSPEAKKRLEKLYYDNYLMLGGSNIEVDLEDEDYDAAFRGATETYRMMSSGSVYKSYGVLQMDPGKNVYVIDERVDNVLKISRARGLFGGSASGSGAFESFGAATANILLNGGLGQNGAAFDLFSYDAVMQYQETLDRLFVREIHFVFRPETHTILVTQVPNTKENVVLTVYVLKSYEELLRDHFAYVWLKKYTMANLKTILGEKYRLFSTLPGAQGGTVMKGEAMAQEGAQERDRLEEDVLLYIDGHEVPQPIRG